MHAAGQWSMDDVNDTLFNAAPNVQQAMTRNIRVTSSDVSRTRKIITGKLKINKLHKKILKKISNIETKSMFDVAYTLANINKKILQLKFKFY